MALATNLQAYWKFDESSGDATDSKNGNTAVNTSVTYGTGKLNNCAIYNGSAYHTVSDNSTIKPTNAISISLWVNITSTSSYQMLLAKGENASDTRSYEIRCYGTTTQLEMQLRAGGGSYINFRSTTALTTGVWYHVVFTRTGTTNKIYINGVEETLAANSTHSGNIDYSTDALWFGQRNGSYRFNGKLDEVALFDVALSADEASQMFNSGRANAYPLTDTPSLYGCIAYFKLDESSGNPQNAVSSYYNMTNVGTMAFGSAKINNGILPDGSNRMVSVQSNNVGFSKGSQNYSWNFWVKMASWTTYITQMTTTAGGGLNTLTYGDSASHIKLHVGGNEVTSSTLSTNTWYMITIVKTGTTYELFVNTTSQGTVAEGSNAASYNTFAIGCNTNDGGITVAGSPMPNGSSADEASIFNRSLSTTDISTLYNSGSGNQYPFNTNATVTPSAVNGTFAIPAYTPSAVRNATVSPSAVTGSFIAQTVAVTGGATQSPSAVNGTFAIPAYSVATADTTVFPTTVGGTFAIPAYTPSGVSNAEVLPSVVTATFAIPTYTVSVTASPTLAIDRVNATFSILTYFVQGDFWNNKFSDSPDSWNDKLSA